MGDKKCNIEASVISYRIALSLTEGNSYILVNKAEEYYRQLTDALVDIKNEALRLTCILLLSHWLQQRSSIH